MSEVLKAVATGQGSASAFADMAVLIESGAKTSLAISASAALGASLLRAPISTRTESPEDRGRVWDAKNEG